MTLDELIRRRCACCGSPPHVSEIRWIVYYDGGEFNLCADCLPTDRRRRFRRFGKVLLVAYFNPYFVDERAT